MSERKPWERQKNETRKAYEAFLAYRDMGLPRTLVAVGKALGKSTTWMTVWSAKWSWVDRVAAYEESVRAEAEHQAFERRIKEQLEEQEEREKQRKTRLGGARILRTVATTAATELGLALQAGEHKQTLTCPKCGEAIGTDRLMKLAAIARQIAPMFDKGAMHERLEEKEPTAIVETRLTRSQELRLAEWVRDYAPQTRWDEAAEAVDAIFSVNGKAEAADGSEDAPD